MDEAKPDAARQGDADQEEAIERGRRLFAGSCTFVMGVARADQMPPAELPEIAFAGRSNVGKSSLINALTGRRALARTSNTPGRTREVNFFDLAGRLSVVDLPGYGYARVSRDQVKAWSQLARDYLRGRATLRRACVLIDSRHGLKDSDRAILALLDEAAVSYQLVLTKIDKVPASRRPDIHQQIAKELGRHAAAHPEIFATSARGGEGIAELRAELASLAA